MVNRAKITVDKKKSYGCNLAEKINLLIYYYTGIV